MADLALVTSDYVNVDTLTVQQHTGIAAEAITAGAPVLFDTNGKWINADANASGKEGAWGIATRTVAAGQSLTVVRRGLMSGWDLSSQAFGAAVYVSNTAGALADAAGSASVQVAHVVPVHGTGTNATADKALYVECTGTGASAA